MSTNLRKCCWGHAQSSDGAPEKLELPIILDARAHLLEAICLVDEAIKPFCLEYLQFESESSQVMLQPIVFSLAVAVELGADERGRGTSDARPIDTDTRELRRLLDRVETCFGTSYFSSQTTFGENIVWWKLIGTEFKWTEVVAQRRVITASLGARSTRGSRN
ncbi:unnamed protein product [Phytophthora lilii]|uniref:Unnamed protein product n=1 Tax=Phytophthora lilii TaxID=2077276 RepID=A0A9W6XHA0_9STRA|nr:unnamed protein product [Phytophthora lilii]